MRHVRMLGLCLIAAFAVVAIAATSASALPEWGQCFKKGAGGKFTNSNCTKKATLKTPGEFEWRKATEVPKAEKEFSGEGGTGVLTATFRVCENEAQTEGFKAPGQTCPPSEPKESHLGPVQVECTTENNNGEASGTKSVTHVFVAFKGCKVFGSALCSNTPNEGEIQVNPLKGELGYINKAKKEVGILLTPAKAKGEFAKFSCAGVLSTGVGVGSATEGAAYLPEKTGGYDGIISPIEPVNQMSKEFTQHYTINEALENIPSKFEGKHIDLLEAYLLNPVNGAESQWSKSGETITNVNHQSAGAEAEIKA